MNRWVALLLAVIGGAILGYLIAILVFGALWQFAFEGNPLLLAKPASKIAVNLGKIVAWAICARIIYVRLMARKAAG